MTQYKLTIGFIIVSILVSTLWYKISESEDDIMTITMESMAAVFSQKVMLIHAQWLMTGKNNFVYIKESALGYKGEATTVSYRVNKFGWPDLAIDHDACARLWKKMTGIELKMVNKPIAVIEVKGKNNVNARVCRYHLNAKNYIEYNSRNGKIIKKN